MERGDRYGRLMHSPDIPEGRKGLSSCTALCCLGSLDDPVNIAFVII